MADIDETVNTPSTDTEAPDQRGGGVQPVAVAPGDRSGQDFGARAR